jgi:hypothetical protein
MLELIGFLYKVGAVNFLLENGIAKKCPSHRETSIQNAKFNRMTQKFFKELPLEVIPTGKKITKVRGRAMHRLHQQNKVVDKCVLHIFMEMARAHPASAGLSDKVIRIEAQKYVVKFNQELHKMRQKRLKEAYSGALLTGGPLSGM